jgi:crotonobetainyl-CoA:carnitine CoA-transferase CaiB-like acyl-CoA transferase
MSGALDGIRVIDFGQYIAGPLAAMLLADQGAEVIRVEPPGGPAWDTPANRTWNRGKRSITLDLKRAADVQSARELVASADVVVENFRPGVMERLGLGPKAMLAAHPQLIYCSMPGFASDDPRAGVAAWEGVVAAAAATYRARLQAGEGSRPVYTAVPISSSYAAFLGAASIAAAMNARDRDGAGQWVEVPLFDATFTAMGSVGQKFHQPPPVRRGGAGWVRQYRCKDGRWVMFHAANTRFMEQFVHAAGVESWREKGLLDRARFASNPEMERLLAERMTAIFLTRTAQEWEDLVSAAGTPCAICRDSAEWLEHPHARESQMVIEVQDPVLGRGLQPGVTPRLDSTPTLVPAPAPLPGAHGSAIRAELAARGPAATDRMAGATNDQAPGPLAGLRVLDLCIILAGPTCGRTLAEFGADVIKIDAPGREGGIAFHHDINRGKRSILLDLKRSEGLEVFWRLLEDADVVVQNYRAGVVERLGIGYDEVRKRKPNVIYSSLNAYGHGGPWEKRPGWEQLAQAATGMQARFGGDGQPVLQPFPVNDYGTGVLGAYGVLLALHERARTGQGQHVRSALAYTACTLQSAFFMDYAGKTWDEPRGQTAVGWSPLHRLYEASDGWFFFGARAEELPRLAHVEGLAGLDAVHSGALDGFLAERFKLAVAAEWVSRLTAAGAGAHRAAGVEEVMTDPWVVAHGLSITREHEGVGLLRTNGPGQRLYRTPTVPGVPAPVPGADAVSVFEEHGLMERFEALVASGVVAVEAP